MIINNRHIQTYSCYMSNIPDGVVKHQKMVFDMFGMELTQEFTKIFVIKQEYVIVLNLSY